MNDDWRRMIEKRLQSLELRSAVDEVHRTNVEGRLGGIEEALKWLVRLIIGALLMAAVAYTVKGGIAVM
jgi:VanZ family protein